jgi:type VI secretion system Hcp family effector
VWETRTFKEEEMIGEYFKIGEKKGPLELFWKISTKVQSDMKNSCHKQGFEKYSIIYGCFWGVDGHIDPQTSQRMGKRFHLPLTVFKRIDHSTPALLTAMIGNEEIKTSELLYLDMDHSTAASKLVKILTITTTGGNIAKIEAGTTEDGQLIEKVSLTFQTISWRHNVATTEATDDWKNIT